MGVNVGVSSALTTYWHLIQMLLFNNIYAGIQCAMLQYPQVAHTAICQEFLYICIKVVLRNFMFSKRTNNYQQITSFYKSAIEIGTQMNLSGWDAYCFQSRLYQQQCSILSKVPQRGLPSPRNRHGSNYKWVLTCW